MNDPVFCKPTLRNVWTNLPLTLSAVAFMTLSYSTHSFPAETATLLLIPALIISAFVTHTYRVFAYRGNIYSTIISALISLALLLLFIRVRYDLVMEQLNSLVGRYSFGVFCAICGLLWLLSGVFCRFLINWMLVRSDDTQEALCSRIMWSRALRITIRYCVIVSACLFFLFAFSTNILLDETFSLKLTALSYSDLIDMTAHDVHPPLYYIMLKLWLDTLSFGSRSLEQIIILSRMFSLLAYVLTATLSYIKLSKSRIASWRWMLLLCFFALHALLYDGLNIRMYSWALFFVTATYLFAIDIINGKGRWATWIAITFFTLCAAYTHYFALISVALIWLFLLYWLLRNDKKLFVRWFMCGIVASAFYFPWFHVLLAQTRQVAEDFHITLSPRLLAELYMWLLSPIHMLIPFMIVKAWRNNRIKCPPFAYLMGIIIPASTAFVGIMVSIAMRPVIIGNYLIPADVCLLIFIFSIYSRAKAKDKFLFVCCLLLSFFLTVSTRIIHFEGYYISPRITHNFVKQISTEDIIFVVDGNNLNVMALCCLTDKQVVSPNFFVFSVGRERIEKMYPNLTFFDNSEEMWNYIINTKKTVYSVEKASRRDGNIPASTCYTSGFVGKYDLGYFYKLTPKTIDY